MSYINELKNFCTFLEKHEQMDGADEEKVRITLVKLLKEFLTKKTSEQANEKVFAPDQSGAN